MRILKYPYFLRKVFTKMENSFQKIIDHIISTMQEEGYDPYEQLCAYAATGNDAFITRKNNARLLISKIDRLQLLEYLSKKDNK